MLNQNNKQGDGWFGYINTALSAGSAYLPSTVTETLLQVILSDVLIETSMAVIMLIAMMMMFSNYDHYDPGTCLCLGAPEPAGKQEHLCSGCNQAQSQVQFMEDQSNLLLNRMVLVKYIAVPISLLE